MIDLVRGESPGHLDMIRDLIVEYASGLPVDVSHERIEAEANALPGDYAPPWGMLLLAFSEGQAVGCAALRPLDRDICELKRVYVRTGARGRRIGRALVESLVREARRIGYRRMRLDTIPELKPALGLYRSLGFRFILPYRSIPTDRAVFMELRLREGDPSP